MARERVNAPEPRSGRQRLRGRSATVARIRARAVAADAEIALSEEDLQALADAGVDPDDVQAVARGSREVDEVSVFDRDTVRDDLEGLLDDEDPQV